MVENVVAAIERARVRIPGMTVVQKAKLADEAEARYDAGSPCDDD
jgi:hypothetical protein